MHLAFLIGFRNRVITLLSWGLHMGDHRSHLNSTARWAYGRQALARAEQVAERDTDRAPAD